jgi:ubiquinone/menaquinone biosynthesis C-methylase UbiE
MSNHHVCPWWLAYTFDNPLRRLIHNPRKILSGYVKERMTVMDVGCGMGYFTLGLAELVGDAGKVTAVDLQQQMLDIMLKRATRKGVEHRIIPQLADPTSISVTTTPVDFVLAFWMVHEVPDPEKFFAEIISILKPTGKILYAEPAFHVSDKQYHGILEAAQKSGITQSEDLKIAFSRATLLTL